MTIVANDAILKFGVQDLVSVALTATDPSDIANNAYSVASDVDSTWSNSEDAPMAAAMLRCQFEVAVTAGHIELLARLLDVDNTNDMPVPDDNYRHVVVGVFPIDFGAGANTNFYTIIPLFQMPAMKAAQIIEWYLKNSGTGQILHGDDATNGWKLWIQPITEGPKT